MKLLACFGLLFTCAVAMGNEPGDEKVYELPDSITVTAERFATPVSKTVWPARVVVVPKNLHQNLPDALDGIAGADLTGYGGVGQLSNIMLWGAPSSQILLLYDGRPVYNYATGGFSLADYDMSELGRIEIVKGTQSSLYGSEAVGGVINLIPKFDYIDRVKAGIEYGSFDYLGYNAGGAKKVGDWHFNGEFNRATTDNSRSNSGIWRNSFAFKGLYCPLRRNMEWRLNYRYFQDSLGLPGPVPDPMSIPYYGDEESQSLVNHQKDIHHSFDAGLKFGVSDGEHDANLSGEFDAFYDRKTLRYFGRYAYLGYSDSVDVIDENKNATTSSGITGRLKLEKGKFNLSGGLEYLSGSMQYDGVNKTATTNTGGTAIIYTNSTRHHNRDTYAGWAGGSYFPNSLIAMDLTGRTESANGGKIRGSINGGIQINPDSSLKLKFAYGDAYRLPAFNDLYWPRDDFTEGNPDLVPEKGQNFLFSVNYSPGRTVRLNSDLFYRKVKDLISWAPLGDINNYGSPRWIPSNLNKSHSTGIDLGVKLLLTELLHIEGDFTYQEARQENKELIFSGVDGTQQFRTAERKASVVPSLKCRLALSGEKKSFNYCLDITYTSIKRMYYSVTSYDSLWNSRISYVEKTLPSCFVADLGLSYAILKNISISLNINDIFDEEPIRQWGGISEGGYPSLGRNIKLGLNFGLD